jgi:hypothetical protein
MEVKNYLSVESKNVRGYEGTIIDIDREADDCIRVRFETDEFECAMYVTRGGDVWETRGYETELETWSADGPFQDYSDDCIYDFIEEGISAWSSYIG